MVVDSTIATYINHGCNGTSNFGDIDEFLCVEDPACTLVSENSYELSNGMKSDVKRINNMSFAYNRHDTFLNSGFDIALRNVSSGEEILTNYLYYATNDDDFNAGIHDLKQQCRGAKQGEVTTYTRAKRDELRETSSMDF